MAAGVVTWAGIDCLEASPPREGDSDRVVAAPEEVGAARISRNAAHGLGSPGSARLLGTHGVACASQRTLCPAQTGRLLPLLFTVLCLKLDTEQSRCAGDRVEQGGVGHSEQAAAGAADALGGAG